MAARTRWDIFCTVIDNYGDIGITWRLARQLVREYDLRVRLWVDDLESFRHLWPEIRPELASQTHAGVEIHRWPKPFPAAAPADVVIEALACHLPESYELAMAQGPAKPIWINLEYLSAEDWIVGCHTLPSPHPRLPLTKHFFMPGYVPGTGGVLKEDWLDAKRAAFQTDIRARNAFWQGLGLPTEIHDELRVSLFSYESQAIDSLCGAWSEGDEVIRCMVPRSKALGDVARFFGEASLEDGACRTRGKLTVHILPMLDMDGYDRLLWACDCNFVRGEDSFVRAQWARKPLVWQAYRQEEDAHWPKIEAFMDRYCETMDERAADPLRALWRLWNSDGQVGTAWPAYRAQWPALADRANSWAARLDAVGDLAANLVQFCNGKS
jgi:uncharacterized repeat protein (TIGR03837 family)